MTVHTHAIAYAALGLGSFGKCVGLDPTALALFGGVLYLLLAFDCWRSHRSHSDRE